MFPFVGGADRMAAQRSEEGDQRLPRGMQEECVRPCTPKTDGGGRVVEVEEAFVESLDECITLLSVTEIHRII